VEAVAASVAEEGVADVVGAADGATARVVEVGVAMAAAGVAEAEVVDVDADAARTSWLENFNKQGRSEALERQTPEASERCRRPALGSYSRGNPNRSHTRCSYVLYGVCVFVARSKYMVRVGSDSRQRRSGRTWSNHLASLPLLGPCGLFLMR
jgi:hypothetical protein